MIVTFYSYKGGVGRSMALANVAELLYQQGRKVIMVDWDLEAPGLESFFTQDKDELELIQSHLGLIDLLNLYKRKFSAIATEIIDKSSQDITSLIQTIMPPITDFLYPIYPHNGKNSNNNTLYLMPAGSRDNKHFSSYVHSVQTFDWADFYNNYQGEHFFEWMRLELTKPSRSDVTLIDSRTGVTEMGGVCTRQLADVVILLVAPNEQNIQGSVAMARSLSSPELIKDTRKERSLSLVFVPSRVEDNEAQLMDEFAEGFNKALGVHFSPDIEVENSYFNDFKIPYVPYYAYREKVAAREKERASSIDLVQAYEKLTDTIIRLTIPVSELYDWQIKPLKSVFENQSVTYTVAKVVILGDSGVGKTSLAEALCGRQFQLTESMHSRRVWRFHVEETVLDENRSVIREILLWDLGGQPGYRFTNQFYLDNTALVLIVFSPNTDFDPLASVQHWNQAVKQSQQKTDGSRSAPKFLVAARVDLNQEKINLTRINQIIKELEFEGYFVTSAREGRNIQELAQAIFRAIPWKELPTISSSRLFIRIRNFLAELRESSTIIYTFNEIFESFLKENKFDESDDLKEEFRTCMSLLESQGLIKRFSFGNLVLLAPELVDSYASALMAAASQETEGWVTISEQDARAGRFRMSDSERISDKEQEELLLIATIEDLIRYEIVVREDNDGNTQLIFPSQSNRIYPERVPEPDKDTVIWEFSGSVFNIYTLLLVRLWNTGLFIKLENFKNAAAFTTENGIKFKLFLYHSESLRAELHLFVDSEEIENSNSIYIEAFINAHLFRRANIGSVTRRSIVVCPKCSTIMSDIHIQKRLEMKFEWIICPVCDTKISIKQHDANPSLFRQRMARRLDQFAETNLRDQTDPLIFEVRQAANDFDVFISFNDIDHDIVNKMDDELKKRGILSSDKSTLHKSKDWKKLVDAQIKQSKIFLICITSSDINAIQQYELDKALQLKIQIISVLLPNSSIKFDDLPPKLKGKSVIDLTPKGMNSLDELINAIKVRML